MKPSNKLSPESMIARYGRVRAATVAASVPLSPEDMVVQSMPDASPTKWHLAHTTWFFETFLLAHFSGYKRFDPNFDFLFNSYYEAVGPRIPRSKRGLLTRPSVEEIFAYRRHVDAAMADALPALPHLIPLLELGINHEQQHLELLFTDIKHAFGQNPSRPAYRTDIQFCAESALPLRWREFDSGLHEVGQADEGFAFDNERPRNRVFLEAFALASRSTTCGEYLAFMEDGGYKRPELWLSDGWQAVQTHAWDAPLYWERHGSCWNTFTLAGMRPVAENEAVCHLSLYEADAFARWSKARLPTEFELEVACGLHESDLEHCDQPRHLHPGTPVGAPFGEVWHWTQSSYSAYPGYEVAAGAIGEYNGKFMCNQMVLRGGSCLTPPSHWRPTYRNFFSPETRWQYTGLRLARSLRSAEHVVRISATT